MLLVFAGGWDASGRTASATYGGTAMTPLGSIISAGGDGIFLLGLINPASDANTVEVTFSSSISGTAGAAVSSTAADQTTGWGTAVTATANSAVPSITVSSATDDLVVDGVMFDATGPKTIAPDASQTERWDVNSTGEGCAGSTEAGAATVSMDWVISGAGTWAQIGVSITAAVAPAEPDEPAQVYPFAVTQRVG